ncbi:bifunctional TH2 protein, mitochondrial [Selaginella moellendorffii]|nr:bifunctional TH2 protein, mitochondrial [Selaginella moellendorffii]|eukprot:XP_024537418.1 bifunctional TH2 protein, mitochondrial [Selaginella moellendorffii]
MVVLQNFRVQDFLEAAELEICAILYHPFNLSTMAGTLSDSRLSCFLRDEGYVLSVASSLSKHQPTKALLMKLSHSIYKGNEDAVTDSAKEMKSFMMKLAADSDVKASVILMAIFHARVFLARTISKYMAPGQSSWISAYNEHDFQVCASLLEKDLETKLLQDGKGGVLEKLFKEALSHQIQIFSSAYPRHKDEATCSSNPWHPVNLLFTTDYDITCTVKDTSEILVSVAKNNSSTSEDPQERYWSLMKVHDNRIKNCLSIWEFESVAAKLTPVTEKRGGLYHLVPGMDLGLRSYIKGSQEQFANPDVSCVYESSNLRNILRQLGDLEKKINKEVMAGGVLKGVRREQIRREVKRIPLLHRCSEFLQQLSEINIPMHCISASWSRDLIIGGLPSLPEGHLFVHSNDLVYDEKGTSDGTFQGVVQDAFDKEAILHALRRMYNVYPDENKRAVFLGDSTNDLLALLDADLGIVMGHNPALREMLLRYNLQLFPLAIAAAHIQASIESGNPKSYRHSGVLFEASGWSEVEACLLLK